MKIAVLGAGIMGSATALSLARRGHSVTLLDAAERPFDGASRWNEGKIHLGHLYAGDPSLATARRLLPGGLAFKRITESLIGCSLDHAITPETDTYLVHRDSVLGAEETGHYLGAVTALARDHPDAASYLGDLRRARHLALTRREREAAYDPATVIAAFRVPERSVATNWVADRFVAALEAADKIELVMETRVVGLRRTTDRLDGPLLVRTSAGEIGPFGVVVNCLWQNRLVVDRLLGLKMPSEHSHRFRLALFVRTRQPVTLASAVLVTGPFGDVKNYGGRNLYLSWYPAGLVAEGEEVAPPPLPPLSEPERKRIASATIEQLGRAVGGVAEVRAVAERVQVAGGWVCAAGTGTLSSRASTLHRRDRAGITRQGSYVTVDTGKYSIAPWLADRLARQISGV